LDVAAIRQRTIARLYRLRRRARRVRPVLSIANARPPHPVGPAAGRAVVSLAKHHKITHDATMHSIRCRGRQVRELRPAGEVDFLRRLVDAAEGNQHVAEHRKPPAVAVRRVEAVAARLADVAPRAVAFQLVDSRRRAREGLHEPRRALGAHQPVAARRQCRGRGSDIRQRAVIAVLARDQVFRLDERRPTQRGLVGTPWSEGLHVSGDPSGAAGAARAAAGCPCCCQAGRAPGC
jgi:hypothetical protein